MSIVQYQQKPMGLTMEHYLQIQKPELGYTYEFETNQLSLMSECLETHGFAVIKDVLPPEVVDNLKTSRI